MISIEIWNPWESRDLNLRDVEYRAIYPQA